MTEQKGASWLWENKKKLNPTESYLQEVKVNQSVMP